jgi:hypothetical protein
VFFFETSHTVTFQPGASTPGDSGSRPFRLLPYTLGPKLKAMNLPSGDQSAW